MKWIDMIQYIHVAQMTIFTIILTIAAIIDARTRTVANYIPVLIILIRLINIEPVSAILGMILVPLPFFIMALLKENSIGGGDIKFMGACGFYLGLQAGYMASLFGLLLAIIIHLIYSMIIGKKINDSIPLVPYLGAGCLIAQFVVK
jgi:leader peptidase (prepilin peptidase)/N-methyltransferase